MVNSSTTSKRIIPVSIGRIFFQNLVGQRKLKKEGKMQTLKVSRMDDIQGVIEKAKRKFGKDKEFAFIKWPLDGTLRLIMTDGKEIKVEKTNEGT